MNRSVKWVVGSAAVLVLLVAAGLIGLELRARSWERCWRNFSTHWEAAGEVFAVEPLLGLPVADEDNFFKYPWFARHKDRKEEVAARLQPGGIEGFDDWNEEEAMPAALAQRVQAHYQDAAADFAGLREAAARPQCRLPGSFSQDGSEAAVGLGLLSSFRDALGANAAAALAVGDEAAAVPDLVLMLEIGRHLRSSGCLLGSVAGVGFESGAWKLITARWRPVLSGDSRAKLLAALDLRATPIGEELATAFRRDRNQMLALLEPLTGAGSSLPELLPSVFASMSQFRRVFIARNRLALCEDAQRLLLAPDGEVLTALRPAAVPVFEEALRQRFRSAKENPDEALAGAFHLSVSGILPALLRSEEEREAARASLR